ncbi:MAG: ATP-binding protein [Actinomycetota bacterium]
MTAPAERKHVTVLFADLAGFTSLAEKLDPEDVTELLLPAMASLQDTVESFGGTIVQVAGDGFFAVFGAPDAQEDHAERAVRAAFAVRERAHTSNLPEVHVGVNSGEVFISPSDDRAGFTLYGDAVNVASRLCDIAAPGVILCGEGTKDLSSHAITFARGKRHRVKGRSDEVLIVEAISAKAQSPAGRAPSRGTAVFSGRQSALDALTKRLAIARATGHAWVVVVRGEAGIGKSRLASEFVSALGNSSVLIGGCSPYGSSIPLSAIARAFEARAGVKPSAPNAAEKITEFASSIGLSPASASKLAAFCGSELTGQTLTLQDSLSIVREVLSALSEAAETLVIVIDDVHWADPELASWISSMASKPWPIPILILALSRPDTPRALERTDRYDLDALSDRGMRAIANEHLGAGATQAVIGAIVRRAGGNPLFLEECIGMLMDSGKLLLESGRWRVTDKAVIDEVPTTLRALLSARLDALDAEAKRAAQVAAVCGTVTWDGLLEHIEERSRSAVARLAEVGLLRRRRSSMVPEYTEYEFKHALIRDVAEASVPKRERAELHVRIAAWFRAQFNDEPVLLEEIAYHLERAYKLGASRVASDAVDYLTRWANEAFLHQARLAESIFTRAISIASQTRVDSGLLAAALAGRADALLENGRHAQATADARRARKLATDRPDLIARAKLIEGSSQSLQGNVVRARVVLNEARETFRSLGDSKGEAASLFRLASTYRLHDMPKVISILRDSKDLATAARDRWGQALALQKLAEALSATTSVEFRHVFAEASLLIGDEANLRLRASLLRTDAYRAMLSAEYARAVELARRARSLAQEAGALAVEADTLLVESTALAACESARAAIETAELIAPIATKLRTKALKALGYCASAVPLQRNGERRRSFARVRAARQIIHLVQPTQLVEVDLALASLHLERGHYARVREPALNAHKRALAIGYGAYAVFGTLAVGRAQLASGKYVEAEATLRACASAAADATKLSSFAAACADQALLLQGGEPLRQSLDASGFIELQAVLLENEAIRNNTSFERAIEAWRTLGLTAWLGRALAFEGNDKEADEIFRALGAPAKIRDRFSSSIEHVRKGGVSWKSL